MRRNRRWGGLFKPSAGAVASPRRVRYLTPLASAPHRACAVPAGEWCNGNTAVFGTVILGSSPSSPATSSPSVCKGCPSRGPFRMASIPLRYRRLHGGHRG